MKWLQQCAAQTRRDEIYMVGPRVHTDLMSSHVFLDQHLITFDDARANHEECRLDILRVQVIEKFPARVMKSAQSYCQGNMHSNKKQKNTD